MKVTIEFEQNFGHADNRPVKDWVFKEFENKLSLAMSKIESLKFWKITSLHVE